MLDARAEGAHALLSDIGIAHVTNATYGCIDAPWLGPPRHSIGEPQRGVKPRAAATGTPTNDHATGAKATDRAVRALQTITLSCR